MQWQPLGKGSSRAGKLKWAGVPEWNLREGEEGSLGSCRGTRGAEREEMERSAKLEAMPA